MTARPSAEAGDVDPAHPGPAYLLAGASVRALAHSMPPNAVLWAADAFQDQDLVPRCAASYRLEPFPDGLQAIATGCPPARWLYTGGIENDPSLIEAVSRHHRLVGAGPEACRRVRSAEWLERVCREAGLAFPETRADPPPPNEGGWLRKARHSSGGLRVHWHDRSRQETPNSAGRALDGVEVRRHIWQRYQPGIPVGAVFVGDGRRARLLGVTRSRMPGQGVDAGDFRYRGSIGPLRLSKTLECRWQRAGEAVAQEGRLVGLFGIDAVQDANGSLHILEVNPRYTSSVEILERAAGRRFMDDHIAACLESILPEDRGDRRRPAETAAARWGKAILYAQSRHVMPRNVRRPFDATESHRRRIADIPQPETVVLPGHPVLTVFARGSSEAEVERRLQRALARARRWSGDRPG